MSPDTPVYIKKYNSNFEVITQLLVLKAAILPPSDSSTGSSKAAAMGGDAVLKSIGGDPVLKIYRRRPRVKIDFLFLADFGRFRPE
jgi:hypothetical protein